MKIGDWGRCTGCGREVPTLELVDTSAMPEFPGDVACGACRGQAEREGRITRSELARRRGALPAKVAWMRERESRRAP
jgi:hypothetical protein